MSSTRTSESAERPLWKMASALATLTVLGTLNLGMGTAVADSGGSSFPDCPQLDETDTGPCVKRLQDMLTRVHPEYNLPGTETFGPATRIALLDFQGRNRLGADGRFGPVTAAEL